MAQAGQCKGTEFPLAGKCTRAMTVHPDGPLLSMGNRIAVFFFSGIFILAYLNCLGHFIAKKLYGGDKARIFGLRTLTCLTGFVSFAAILVSRTDEYAETGIKGVTFFTIMVMIHMGTTLMTIALITMDYVDRTLIRDGDTRVNVGYTKATKIVCGIYLLAAAFQVIFYAAVGIKFLGKKREWVRATHYVALGMNVLGVGIASLMFLVGQVITGYGIKSIRSKAAACVSWACMTILACIINLYCIAFYHFGVNEVPKHFPKFIADIILLQQELTPYIMTNLLLFLSACLQHYANIVILIKDSDEMYPMEASVKWIMHLFGRRYRFDVVVGSTNERGSTYNRSYTGRNKTSTVTNGLSSVATDDEEEGVEPSPVIVDGAIEMEMSSRRKTKKQRGSTYLSDGGGDGANVTVYMNSGGMDATYDTCTTSAPEGNCDV